jgi:hypothetical protein
VWVNGWLGWVDGFVGGWIAELFNNWLVERVCVGGRYREKKSVIALIRSDLSYLL